MSVALVITGGFGNGTLAGDVNQVITFGYLSAAPDATAPVLSNATGISTGQTTATGTVDTDEGNGTLYFLATVNVSESAATIKTGGSQSVTTTGTQNVSFTGLTASTDYYAHYVHDDSSTNESNVVSSASFTTDEAVAHGPSGNSNRSLSASGTNRSMSFGNRNRTIQ